MTRSEIVENRKPVDPSTRLIALGYYDIWAAIDNLPLARSLAEKYVHQDFVGRFPTESATDTGPEHLLRVAQNRRRAFTHSRFQIKSSDIYKNEANEIVVPFVFLGVYRGSFFGQAAQGKSVAMDGVVYLQLKDGKIIGGRSTRNLAKLCADLGIAKMPEGQTDEI